MKTCTLLARNLLIGLCLLAANIAASATTTLLPLKTGDVDKLVQILKGENLRADENTEEKPDPGFTFDETTGVLELTKDFLVTKVFEIKYEKIKKIQGNGILYRAGEYKGTILIINSNINVSFEAKIDGSNEISNEAEIIIKEGGTLVFNGTIQNITHDKSSIPVINNQGTLKMQGGSFGDFKIQNPALDNSAYSLYNQGIVELIGGKISKSILNQKKIILNQSTTSPCDIELINCEGEPLTIASPIQSTIKLTKGNYSLSSTWFTNGDIVAQGNSTYTITESDREKLPCSGTSQTIVTEIKDNKIYIKSGGNPGLIVNPTFNLQEQINAATGTANNPTLITIPEEGIELSESVTIDNKHIKITGGTIKADFSKIEYPHFIKMESGTLILENITLDGNKKVAEANNKKFCSFIHINGGTCYLKKGFVLKNVLSHWDFYNPLLINGGVCYMEEGAKIQFNKCSLGGTVAVYKEGKFVLKGGVIYANEDGYNGIVTDQLQHGTVYVAGTMEFESGEVSHDYVSIGVRGNLVYKCKANTNNFTDAIKIFKGGVINVTSSITNKCNILINTSHNDTPQPGDVIAKGIDGYQLTENDLQNIKMPEGYSLKLQNNTFILSKEGESGRIDSLADLIAAVNAAPAGTADNPTTLEITSSGIDFDQTLEINGKHIRLTGNAVVYSNVLTTNICLFKITNGGSLTIDSGTVSGTKNGTNVCNTAFYVSNNSTLTLNKVNIEKFLSEIKTWSMLRIYGSCYLNNCQIYKNNGESMIYIGPSGKCEISAGRIQENNCLNSGYVSPFIINLGTLNYYSGIYSNNQAISIQSEGTVTVKAATIQNYLSTSSKETGSGIMFSGPLNLYNTATIGDSFYLMKTQNKKGYINLHSALKKNIELVCHDVEDGWTAVKGVNYSLTQADLSKIVLTKALAAEYTLQLVNNTFVLKKKGSGETKYDVTVETCKNGKLTTDKTKAAKGETVTITATANKGYKLYTDQLCYNRYYQLQAKAGVANTFTFNMPSTNAHVVAEFIPEKVTVTPPETGHFDPNKDVTPGNGFGNLDSLITLLGNTPDKIKPETKPIPDKELPAPLGDEVEKATNNGDEHFGSLEELITLIYGTSQTRLTSLPCKIRLTFYLPKSKLRADKEDCYYILCASDGKVTTILPEYDTENNALRFETDKLGIFAVMYGKSATANEEIMANALCITINGKQINLENLPAGEPYNIYTLSGQTILHGISNGSQVSHLLNSGTYIIQCNNKAYKVYIK